MTRLPTPGSDDGQWGKILNDFLVVEHNTDGTLKASGSLAAKANDNAVVHIVGDEQVGGVKTFTSVPLIPINPGSDDQAAASKYYVDHVAVSGAPAATSTTPGIVQLTGDLGGTATSPTVPGLAGKQAASASLTTIAGLTPANDDVMQYKAGSWTNRTTTQVKTDLALTKTDVGLGSVDNTSDANKPISTATQTALNAKVPTTRTIGNGTGISGGGDLSADRTLSVVTDSTVQKVEVASAGTLQGTRKRLNFIAGSNVTLTMADDTANNKIDITIASSGGGGGTGPQIFVQSTDPSASAVNGDLWIDTSL